MPNLFLFTGEESFLVHQELTKRKQSFVEKYGEHGLFVFKHDELDPAILQNTLLSGGMFSEKKLVILRGIPQDTLAHNKASTKSVEKVVQLLTDHSRWLSDDTIVICVSYKPDKRLKGYKWFVSNATIKEFAPVDDKQKAAYIEQRIPGLLDTHQKELLISIAGENLFHLRNECKKLHDRAIAHHIDKVRTEDMESIIVGTATMNVFTILDHLYSSPDKALRLITDAQTAGQDMFQFLGMLYRWLELSLSVLNLYENDVKDTKQIASLLKAHPFAVSKQMKLLPILQDKKRKVIVLYNALIEIDAEIKTGQLPQEGFWVALKSAINQLNE